MPTTHFMSEIHHELMIMLLKHIGLYENEVCFSQSVIRMEYFYHVFNYYDCKRMLEQLIQGHYPEHRQDFIKTLANHPDYNKLFDNLMVE